jgi:hypothetical protein
MCVFLPSFSLVDPIIQLIVLSVNIESEGAYAPERLFKESIKVMRGKIATLREAARVLAPAGSDVNMDTS